jgi:hypothetical protein
MVPAWPNQGLICAQHSTAQHYETWCFVSFAVDFLEFVRRRLAAGAGLETARGRALDRRDFDVEDRLFKFVDGSATGRAERGDEAGGFFGLVGCDVLFDEFEPDDDT